MKSPLWKYCSSIYLRKEHCTLYRDENLGVQLQVIMKRYWSFIRPKEKCFYFIDGVNRVFKSSLALERALEKIRARRPILRLSTNQKKHTLVADRPGGVRSRVSATG